MASMKERDGKWTVRWREGGVNRRRTFQRKGEASAWRVKASGIELAEKNGQTGAPGHYINMTLKRYWPEWRDSRLHLSDSTQSKDAWVWSAWLKPHLGKKRMGAITHQDLNRLLAKVTASGAGPDTRIAVYGRLNMMLDEALGPDNHTCRRAKAGTSKRKRKIRPLTDAEIDRLLEAMPERDRLLVDLLATMGLRPFEAFALTGADIHDGTVYIAAEKQGTKERTLPLPDRIRDRVEGQAVRVGPHAHLFDVADYRTWRRRVFKPSAEKAGLGEVVPYDLRHSCASKLIARGATVTDVAEWMGHSPEMCLRTYSHLFTGRLTELSSLLDRP